MTRADKPAFARLMAGLAATYAEPFTGERVALYFGALEDLPLEAVTAAVGAALRRCEFCPRPARLRELAGEVDPDAGLVEALVVDHLRLPNGERTTPRDPFLALVLERLGGVYHAAGLSAAERGAALRGLVPGVLAACRAGGIPLPRQVPSASAVRLLAAAGREPAPVPALPATMPARMAEAFDVGRKRQNRTGKGSTT